MRLLALLPKMRANDVPEKYALEGMCLDAYTFDIGGGIVARSTFAA